MMAERRKQALLASGVQIEGLQPGSSNSAAKKVVYGSRKKGPDMRKASPAPTSRPLSPEPVIQPIAQPSDGDGVKDDWDLTSEDEAPKVHDPNDVKESWEASSDEDISQIVHAPAPSQQLPASTPKGIHLMLR
jgi:translation initiation factor 5B